MNIPSSCLSVAEVLQRLPHVAVEIQKEDHLMVRVARHSVAIQVLTRNSSFPRDVRQAVWQAQPGKRSKI